MNLPFALPDWMPGWLPIVVLLPTLLYALVFLAIPFGVFGVKGRLDMLEARLDEIQSEIRLLSLRLPEPPRGGGGVATVSNERPGYGRPPIPPAAGSDRTRSATAAGGRPASVGADSAQSRSTSPEESTTQEVDRAASRRRPAERPDRAEPRLDWPR